uniref:Uncharacterized protein n=1 Tax=Octactis speculum TaxID=3111310 RepID=A0A7S2FR73_9STRA
MLHAVAREAFRNFDVGTTKCYSPMDQHRLIRIIDAVGRHDFNNRIRKMAKVPQTTPRALNSFELTPNHKTHIASNRGKRFSICSVGLDVDEVEGKLDGENEVKSDSEFEDKLDGEIEAKLDGEIEATVNGEI